MSPSPSISIPWHVGVIIPARDEASSVEESIEMILRSAEHCLRIDHLWIVVVADDCRDTTADRARSAIGPRGEVIECSMRSPGAARRLGASAALARFTGADPKSVWLANTDADTFVPRDWLGQQLRLADAGAPAVAGVVDVHSVPGRDRLEISLLMADYVVNSDGTHPHVHGANLGVRADAYLDAGGWSQLALAEDHCLWGRLKSRGWRVQSSALSTVLTSGRLEGRAAGGFADTLKSKIALRDARQSI